MARLSWSIPGENQYETGVDRGVLYVDLKPGVAWSGLASINETPSGGEIRSYYQDGIKYEHRSTREEFSATIDAFMYPPEFEACDGTARLAHGLFATQQVRRPFGLTYRTLVNSDLQTDTQAYKIHLVYNAIAEPSSRNNVSMGSNVEPLMFSWSIQTRPVLLNGYGPTAHFVIDSRMTPSDLMVELESILYGSNEHTPSLPNPNDILLMFNAFAVLDGGSASALHNFVIDGGIATSIHTESISGGSA